MEQPDPGSMFSSSYEFGLLILLVKNKKSEVYNFGFSKMLFNHIGTISKLSFVGFLFHIYATPFTQSKS
jgi:hypothetical protein